MGFGTGAACLSARGKLTRVAKAIVAELAKPFQDEGVKEAIATCFERSREFIADDCRSHFKLEDLRALSSSENELERNDPVLAESPLFPQGAP